MTDVQLPLYIKDSENTKYRIISDITEDEQPLILLQQFAPRHWNQNIEDASDDDFFNIASTESSDIYSFIEDYLGPTEAL